MLFPARTSFMICKPYSCFPRFPHIYDIVFTVLTWLANNNVYSCPIGWDSSGIYAVRTIKIYFADFNFGITSLILLALLGGYRPRPLDFWENKVVGFNCYSKSLTGLLCETPCHQRGVSRFLTTSFSFCREIPKQNEQHYQVFCHENQSPLSPRFYELVSYWLWVVPFG